MYGEYAIAGNTGHMKCQIPAFVRDYVKVTAWMKGDTIVATSLSPKGKVVILMGLSWVMTLIRFFLSVMHAYVWCNKLECFIY